VPNEPIEHPLPPLEMVCWVDAHYSRHQDEVESPIEPITCFHVGFVTRETDLALCLAGEWSPADQANRFFITIPLSMIQWRSVLPWPRRKIEF